MFVMTVLSYTARYALAQIATLPPPSVIYSTKWLWVIDWLSMKLRLSFWKVQVHLGTRLSTKRNCTLTRTNGLKMGFSYVESARLIELIRFKYLNYSLILLFRGLVNAYVMIDVAFTSCLHSQTIHLSL